MFKVAISSYFLPSHQFDHKAIRGVVGQNMILTSQDYLGYVYESGGFPILVAPINNSSYIKEIVHGCDMLLLAGGEDVASHYYNQESTPYEGTVIPERDAFEMSLLQEFISAKKPVFGICRGFQLMNVFLGGNLYQDYRFLDSKYSFHCEQPYQKLIHSVELKPFLGDIYKKKNLMVNSHHHQFIDQLAESLEILAVADEGIIEAFKSRDGLLLAVQWHPEMLYHKYPEHLKVLQSFIASNCSDPSSSE